MGALHLSEVTHSWTVPLGTEVFRDNQGERVRGCRLYFIVCDLHTQIILTFYFLCSYYKLFSAPPALPDCCQLRFFVDYGASAAMVPEVWSVHQPHQQHLGTCEKYKFRPQLRPIESETLQLGPSSLVWWAFWVSLMLPSWRITALEHWFTTLAVLWNHLGALKTIEVCVPTQTNLVYYLWQDLQPRPYWHVGLSH